MRGAAAQPDERLVTALAGLASANAGGRPPLIGISGAQGSGKTTLVRAVAPWIGAAAFSLDDVYLTRAARLGLARDAHPLMATRGPPGTHDLRLLLETVEALATAGPSDRTPLPAFDKLADDRLDPSAWPMFIGRPGAILIDGWCMGAKAQAAEDLVEPVNALERDEDPDGGWRTAVNDALAGPYAALFDRFDSFLHLAAPDFGVVQGWREEQEAGLLGGGIPEGRKRELARFIQHYERITRSMLAGGRRDGVIARLGPHREVSSVE
jgi:D-glycerate 3-kinase